ncbi:MAG TPA: UDP-2,3-diacylglucosamine diphosphatase [Bacteroidia bacterium]|jgi:UDP-2,3-diacylglucosamine pyrophosphatase LpxH|nr:UDP-2,3-diacylglucosamine diphosphatase [Bacteroidia bacterium]
MGGTEKRKVDVVVLSDVHLGTYGCHAEELSRYLKSIEPGRLILNGDIIDIWQFSKRYWPQSHMKVVKRIINLMTRGVKVTYITGNHDEMLRKFTGLKIGKMKIKDKTVLKLSNGKSAWIFHGDVFDVTMQHSKWLAKLGAVGYDTLILLNRFINYISVWMGRGKISLSKKIKDSVKSAVKFINNFEKTAADIGISNGYDYVVCGHIHQPEIREIHTDKGSITYMNSGDWIENLTALEYNNGEWSIYKYNEADFPHEDEFVDPNQQELFNKMLEEFMVKGKK